MVWFNSLYSSFIIHFKSFWFKNSPKFFSNCLVFCITYFFPFWTFENRCLVVFLKTFLLTFSGPYFVLLVQSNALRCVWLIFSISVDLNILIFFKSLLYFCCLLNKVLFLVHFTLHSTANFFPWAQKKLKYAVLCSKTLI